MLSQIMTKISGGVTFLGGVLIVFGLVNLGMSSSSNRKKVATTFICEENASSPKSAIINHPFWMPFASYGTNTQ